MARPAPRIGPVPTIGLTLSITLLLFSAVPLAEGRTIVASAPPTGKWVELAIAGPSNRSDYGFAWGTPLGGSPFGLFFGGRAYGHLYDQTWVFENNSWSELFPEKHPPNTRYPALAWDPPLNEFVLFGGSGRTYVNTTWTFRNGTWTQLRIAHPPPARRSAGMAYDPTLGELILFGGHNSLPGTGCNTQSTYTMFNDTWAFNGTAWTNLTQAGAPVPPPVSEPALAWDPAVGALIDFGGYDQVNHGPGRPTTYEAFNSTWAFVNGGWQNLSLGEAPFARDGAAMTFDPDRGGLILFGGQDMAASRSHYGVDNDTWMLTGPSLGTLGWTEISTTSAPPKVSSMIMVWDTTDQEAVEFGGIAGVPPDPGLNLHYYDQTWTFD